MNPDLVSVFADIINDQNRLRYTSSAGNVDIDRAPANSTECANNWSWMPTGSIGSNWELRWNDSTTSDTPLRYFVPIDHVVSPSIAKYELTKDLRTLLTDEPEPIKVSTEELKERMSEFADEIFA